MIVFVGEKRSKRAIEMGVTWDDGALASRSLHDALDYWINDNEKLLFVNLWRDHGVLNHETIRTLRLSVERRRTVVGMGRKVQKKLRELGIRHKELIHPAARGAIRKRANYRMHVLEVLSSPPSAYCWRP